MDKTARLALADGSVWRGTAFGTGSAQVGEVVFNTSLTGYQEILTDPSYAGQLVVMTAPQIGNTGINDEDDEARQIFLSGLIVRELSPVVSNWRATKSLSAYLEAQGVIGISGIDTRALTRRLRDGGSLKGVLSTETNLSDDDLVAQARGWNGLDGIDTRALTRRLRDGGSLKGVLSTETNLSDDALVAQARGWNGLDGIDMVRAVSCKSPYNWDNPTSSDWEFRQWAKLEVPAGRLHVVAYDFGIKHNILRRFAAYGCHMTVVPATTSAEDVLALRPDGVFLSNGPGDPSALPYTVQTTRDLLGRVPIFGICLGHQILGQAFGGKTYRLKFGHHGGNQPVKYLPTGRVEISAHNHNYAVDPATLPPEVEVTHINLNDGCCEGMRHTSLPALSIQYHPEAAPGPHDCDPLFAEFVKMMAVAYA